MVRVADEMMSDRMYLADTFREVSSSLWCFRQRQSKLHDLALEFSLFKRYPGAMTAEQEAVMHYRLWVVDESATYLKKLV